ncbi:hypothetical protein ALQ08_104480 [Pseudomonas syringae pv. delphinii]|uniref:Uncharacterized protein n=1 Tax=Pseudomonas syringae pv. delphinii TaxID=192088 RepID=A0A0P9PPE9_9PSED|nr:hypothetical protein ALO72_103682 [Pseudomonas syringae pv. delphinii]RMP10525.1 hypothetical protein ALQ28_104272 [Pseudomonas syringae pv. delphinii]RMP21049.1 hypothetical protein ALQ27_104556 [Pseudomonas syringae pv. delphinii]RMQ28317.1 hypothetical protein ALQ08_104480 [Pseudomonas syringae pv. delphinii]
MICCWLGNSSLHYLFFDDFLAVLSACPPGFFMTIATESFFDTPNDPHS